MHILTFDKIMLRPYTHMCDYNQPEKNTSSKVNKTSKARKHILFNRASVFALIPNMLSYRCLWAYGQGIRVVFNYEVLYMKYAVHMFFIN